MAEIIKSSSDDRTSGEIDIHHVMKHWGLTARAVRFYEACELLSPRRQGRSRIYTVSDLERVGLILQAKRLGFTLAEIRDILPDTSGDNRLQLTEEKCLRKIAIHEAEMAERAAAVDELRKMLAELQPAR